jgi:hypothetical protein
MFFSFLFNGLLFNYNLSKLSFLFDLFEDLSKQSLMSFYFGLKNEQFLMNFFQDGGRRAGRAWVRWLCFWPPCSLAARRRRLRPCLQSRQPPMRRSKGRRA